VVYNSLTSNQLLTNEYHIIFLFILIAVLLTASILGATFFLAHQKPNTEKKSAYECGFEPFEDARGKMDIKFCILAILFAVFDIEILFLLPWCFSVPSLKVVDFWVGCEFILELLIGLFYVWAKKMLDW
jgi:NADH:ubiquinone oxidoreductase subunit 3 (subunit A)